MADYVDICHWLDLSRPFLLDVIQNLFACHTSLPPRQAMVAYQTGGSRCRSTIVEALERQKAGNKVSRLGASRLVRTYNYASSSGGLVDMAPLSMAPKYQPSMQRYRQAGCATPALRGTEVTMMTGRWHHIGLKEEAAEGTYSF